MLSWEHLSGILMVQTFPERCLMSYSSVEEVRQCSVFHSGGEKQNPWTRDVLPNKSEEVKSRSGMFLFTLKWGLQWFPGSCPCRKRACCLTRVEQNDSFEADKLLGFELQHAEARRGGEQHVEYLGHSLDTVALIPIHMSPQKKSSCPFVKKQNKTLFKKHKSGDTKLGPWRSILANNNGGQRRRWRPIRWRIIWFVGKWTLRSTDRRSRT